MPKSFRSLGARKPHLLRTKGMAGEISEIRDDLVEWTESAFVTTERLDIYVDPVLGRDSNPGTTSRQPLQSLDAAFDRIPLVVQDVVHVHLASGTYSWGGTLGPRMLGARVYIHGDGAGKVGDDGFVVVATGTVQSGTTASVLVTSGGLTTDLHHGRTLEITSGVCVGDRRSISTNTTTDIVPAAKFRGIPAPGDTYRIVRPAVVIQRPISTFPASSPPFAAPAFVGIGNQGSKAAHRHNGTPGFDLYLVNLRLTAAAAGVVAWDFHNSAICMLGVEFYEETGMLLSFEACSRSLIQAGFDYRFDRNHKTVGPMADGIVDDAQKWRGWGLTQPLTDSDDSAVGFAAFTGYCCLQKTTIEGDWYVYGGSFIELADGFNTLVARNSARVTLGGYLPTSSNLPVIIKNSSSTDIRVSCIKSQDGAIVNLIHATVEKTNRGFGVQAVAVGDHETVAPGHISIAGDVGFVNINAISATNAPDYAVVAAGGGRVNWHDRYLVVSDWPAGQDFAVWAKRIDQNAAEFAQDYEDFLVDGDVLVSADGSVIQRY